MGREIWFGSCEMLLFPIGPAFHLSGG
jgi:hypothetical protein